MVRHRDSLVEQAAGILAQVQHQSLDVVLTQPFQVLFHFPAGGFAKTQDLEIRVPRLDPEGILHALPADFVADHGEGQVVRRTFAGNDDLYRCAARSLQHVGDFGGVQAFGGLVVYRNQNVARANSRLIRRRTRERGLDGGLAVGLRAHLHADAVVVALLLFAHQLVFARIEEVGVRVERAQHARNRALVDGLIGADFVGKVGFHQGKHFAEIPHVIVEILPTAPRRKPLPPSARKSRPQSSR